MDNKEPKPIYEHDCPVCHFLCTFKGHDLYYCEEGNPVPTVIARYGSKGHEYMSGMAAKDASPYLQKAYSIAVSRGLIKK